MWSWTQQQRCLYSKHSELQTYKLSFSLGVGQPFTSPGCSPVLGVRRSSRQADVIVSFQGIFSTFFLILLLFSLHLRPPCGCISTIGLSFIGNGSPDPTHSRTFPQIQRPSAIRPRLWGNLPLQSLSRTDTQSRIPFFSSGCPYSRWTWTLSFFGSQQKRKLELHTRGDSFRTAWDVILLSPKTSAPPFLPSVLQTLGETSDALLLLNLKTWQAKSVALGFSLQKNKTFFTSPSLAFLSISCISPSPGC